MKVQRRKKKLEPAKIQKQLEDAEKRVVEVCTAFSQYSIILPSHQVHVLCHKSSNPIIYGAEDLQSGRVNLKLLDA